MNSFTVKRKFALWGLALVVLPSLMIMAVYTIGQVETAKQQNYELMNNTMEFQKKLLEQWLAERAATVQEIADDPHSRTQDLALLEGVLLRKLQADRNFDSLSFINKDGYFVISTLSGGIRFPSAVDRPYYLAAKKGDSLISDVVIGRNSGRPIINFSSPVYDPQGNFQGVILGSVHTMSLERLIGEYQPGKTGEVLLVSRNQTLITEPRLFGELTASGRATEPARMNFKMTSDAVRKIRLGESGTTEWIDYRGNKVIGAYQDMPERGWTLVSKIDTDEVLEPVYRQLLKMAGVSVLFLLLLVPFVSIMSNQIKRPIDWLVDQSGLIAQEKYELVGNTRPVGKMPSELALLCNTFINMSKLLERNIGLLKEHELELIGKVMESQELNATLEEEVAEREAAQLALAEMNAGLETIVQQRTQELQEMNASLEEEIAERKATQEELEQQNAMVHKLAYTDVLTGLANRAGLNERLATELAMARREDTAGAVIFIDLDDFKMVNDAFGHSYGDALLRAAGERLTKIVGSNAYVGRVGGDEYMLIYHGAKHGEIAEIAAQIIHALNRDFAVQGIHFRVSASAGITLYPEDGDTTEDIFKNADNAMYAAKAAGKNRWQFYQTSMQTDAYEKVLLIDQLRNAADRRELSLHYQPQIRSSDRAVIGFEALLRWQHPQHGAISPVRFIPLAEQSGLIQSIGEWVVREACQFGRTLTEAGWPDIQIAVNVSPYQLCYEGFVDSVKQALYDAELDPGRLELEITENTLIASMDDSSSALRELRELGVGLALDDFGTGYSSLTYLQVLPASTLKIDKTFIDKLRFDDEQQSIVKTIVDLAHSLKMTVIAEGVETEEQLAYLKCCQCDQIQGYVFSQPLPEQEALAFLQDFPQ